MAIRSNHSNNLPYGVESDASCLADILSDATRSLDDPMRIPHSIQDGARTDANSFPADCLVQTVPGITSDSGSNPSAHSPQRADNLKIDCSSMAGLRLAMIVSFDSGR